MSCPRIRSVKPERAQDERYGRMSRDARYLFDQLISMADDEGRLRAVPSMILGFAFPYDEDAPTLLRGWLDEVLATNMVVAYRHDDAPYLAFRNWKRHQQINKATPSDLPPPPDPTVVRQNRTKKKGTLREKDGKTTVGLREDSSSPAQARGSDPILSLPVVVDVEEQQRPVARKRVNPDELPKDFPDHLAGRAREVLAVLLRAQSERGGDKPTLRALALAISRYPGRDHVGVAHDLEAWEPSKRTIKSWTGTYGTFLDGAVDSEPGKPALRAVRSDPLKERTDERRARAAAAQAQAQVEVMP